MAMPAAVSFPKLSRARLATLSIRNRSGQEQAEQHQGSDETQLLRQYGEYEIGVLHSEKMALAWVPARKPLPYMPPEPMLINA